MIPRKIAVFHILRRWRSECIRWSWSYKLHVCRSCLFICDYFAEAHKPHSTNDDFRIPNATAHTHLCPSLGIREISILWLVFRLLNYFIFIIKRAKRNLFWSFLKSRYMFLSNLLNWRMIKYKIKGRFHQIRLKVKEVIKILSDQSRV